MKKTTETATENFKPYYHTLAVYKKWQKVASTPCFQDELIEACKNGDPKAQLKLYKSYYQQMFNISHKLVCNADAADEIVRESFMIVFEKINAFKGIADLTSWLKRLVEDRSTEGWKKSNISYPGLKTDKAIVK